MTDLKPCPFCGSDDARQEYGAGSKPPYSDPYVVCVDCGASVAGKAGAWNTRANIAGARERKLVEALKRADQFIRNGIELGYIRMPDDSTSDPAKETPGIVSATLKEFGYE